MTTVVVSETFASATNFTNVVGTLAAVSGHLQPNTAAADAMGHANTDMPSDDHYVEAVMVADATTDTFNTILARWNGLGQFDTNASYYGLKRNFNVLQLVRKAAGGSETLLAGFGSVVPHPGTYTLRLEVVGDQISVRLNGTLQGTSPYTDTAVTSGAKVGVLMYNQTNAADVRFDTFEAGVFVPAPGRLPNRRHRALLIR